MIILKYLYLQQDNPLFLDILMKQMAFMKHQKIILLLSLMISQEHSNGWISLLR